MMEFEEIQKVWDEQKGETMYAINEAALHRSVTRKKASASRRINRVEILGSLVNGTLAIFLFTIAFKSGHEWAFLSSGLLAGTVVYIQYLRWKRKKAENTFDRSMLGELDHAISNTTFIIRFNYFIAVGYLLPLAFINLIQMIVREDSWEKWLFVTGTLLLAFAVVIWEQRACNVPRKKQLIALKRKLLEE